MRCVAIATGTEVLQNMQVRRGGVGSVCLGLLQGGAHITRTMASVTAYGGSVEAPWAGA